MSAALNYVATATSELAARDTSNPATASRPPIYKVIGLCLAIASGLFIGTSFVLKKVGLLKANVKYNQEAGEGYGYLKNAYWWTGMTLMIVGEICNFVAYAFVDAILVTPLGALSVVVTTILSAIFLKERLSFVGKIGCFMCIIGSGVIVLNAPQQSSVATIQQMESYVRAPGFLSYAGVIIVGSAVVAFWAGPKYGKKSMLVYLTICSLVGGLSVVATQGLGAAVVAQAGGTPQFNQWFLYVLLAFVVATLLTEIVYLNKALNLFNAALVTPTYYVYFTSSTIVASAVLFQGFKGTPISIITVVLGFLQICAGVVLLQLSKSAKDVPDTAVLNSDLDQIRTVGEQEQPESEPKADAIRGTAALLRRFSQSRQKWEVEEARRVYEDKLRDQMEPIAENERVEWDGLRRRKTVLGPQRSLSRRGTLHPPLGLTRFPNLDGDVEVPMSPPPSDIKGTSLGSRTRTLSSRISVQPFAAGKTPFAMPTRDGSTDDAHFAKAPGTGESVEMKHVFGLPSGLQSYSDISERVSPSPQPGKPIVWASDTGETPRPKHLVSPSPRGPAKRQFSFQNMFHRGRDDQEGLRNVKDSQHLKVTTEEERMGLTKGDSNTSSSSESSPAEERVGNSENALPLGMDAAGASLPQYAERQWSDSSLGPRTPGGGRSLPPIPTEDEEDDDGDADYEKKMKEVEYRRPGTGGSGSKDRKGGADGAAFL